MTEWNGMDGKRSEGKGRECMKGQLYSPTRVDAPSASRKLKASAVIVSLMRLGTGRPVC
jgi:hypothetical protein